MKVIHCHLEIFPMARIALVGRATVQTSRRRFGGPGTPEGVGLFDLLIRPEATSGPGCASPAPPGRTRRRCGSILPAAPSQSRRYRPGSCSSRSIAACRSAAERGSTSRTACSWCTISGMSPHRAAMREGAFRLSTGPCIGSRRPLWKEPEGKSDRNPHPSQDTLCGSAAHLDCTTLAQPVELTPTRGNALETACGRVRRQAPNRIHSAVQCRLPVHRALPQAHGDRPSDVACQMPSPSGRRFIVG